MKIKTPVQFGPFNTLEDADGQTILDITYDSTVFPETKQAIIGAFENAARFEFMQAACVAGSRERALLNELAITAPQPETPEALAKAIDSCRAALAS